MSQLDIEYRSMLLKVSDLVKKTDLRRILYVKHLSPRDEEDVGDDVLKLFKLMEDRDELSMSNLRGIRELLQKSLPRYLEAKELLKSFERQYGVHMNVRVPETPSPNVTPEPHVLAELGQRARELGRSPPSDSIDGPPPPYCGHTHSTGSMTIIITNADLGDAQQAVASGGALPNYTMYHMDTGAKTSGSHVTVPVPVRARPQSAEQRRASLCRQTAVEHNTPLPQPEVKINNNNGRKLKNCFAGLLQRRKKDKSEH